MRILLLDSRNLYSKSFIKKVDKSWDIDLVTEEIISQVPTNVRIIYGSRREPGTYKTLLDYYDVVLDTDSLVVEDIDSSLSTISTGKYILLSSAQVYRFLQDTIHTEDEIYDEYVNELNQEYIDYDKNPEKFYIKEKIGIENRFIEICKNKNIHYYILRLSKYYCKQDYYKDVTWIINHIKNGNTIMLHERNIKETGYFNPIYEDDFLMILDKIIRDEKRENRILNIGQDQVVSLISLSKIVSNIIDRMGDLHIVCVPEENREVYKTIRVPCNSLLLVNNSKVKELYNVSFTDTKEWVNEICENILKKYKKITLSEEEKTVTSEYKRYISLLNTQYENKSGNSDDCKNEKGKIVSFYENR